MRNWDKAVSSIKPCSGVLSSIPIKPHMSWQTLLTQTSCILCYAIGLIKNTLTFDDWETIIMLNSCILYSVTGSCENLALYNKWKAPWVVITVLSCTTLHMNNYQHQIVTTVMSSWLNHIFITATKVHFTTGIQVHFTTGINVHFTTAIQVHFTMTNMNKGCPCADRDEEEFVSLQQAGIISWRWMSNVNLNLLLNVKHEQ